MKKTKEKEHYLKEIYKLESNDQAVSVSGLSVVFGISKSSVSNMVKKLVVMKLLNSAPYKAIELTSEGRELARTIVAKHRLVELFLVEVMGFEPENVHEIAEEIEHIDSPPFFRKVKQMLSQQKMDPHGSPIPDVEF
ncbi:metal-dependent transcriptional regulator [Flavobacteriaceae bacterium]|nr:metal-dependent transcriptional regulator [Flavobacteriaceae bacterium]